MSDAKGVIEKITVVFICVRCGNKKDKVVSQQRTQSNPRCSKCGVMMKKVVVLR